MTMARYSGVVTDQAGNIITNAKIEVRREVPGAPLAALKSDRDGLVGIGNPFNANADGTFSFHAIGGAYKVRAYVGPSGAPTFEDIRRYQAIGLAAESDNVAIDGAFGFRNRLINPSGQIAQAGLASTADGAYTGFDQWLALTQSNPVTPSALTGIENGTPYMMRLTQANASAQRFGLLQWIESVNCLDLRGQSVVLSARVRMSASGTLRFAIVEWTGTADTITKDIVNDWTSGIFTAGNFFKSATTTVVATGSVSLSAATLETISLAGSISGAANNLAVFFWTDSTQAQNVMLDIGKAQFEAGSAATALAFRSYQQEMALCQRYFGIAEATQRFYAPFASLFQEMNVQWPAQMRATPTVTVGAPAYTLNIAATYPQVLSPTPRGALFTCGSAATGDVICRLSTLTLNARL